MNTDQLLPDRVSFLMYYSALLPFLFGQKIEKSLDFLEFKDFFLNLQDDFYCFSKGLHAYIHSPFPLRSSKSNGLIVWQTPGACLVDCWHDLSTAREKNSPLLIIPPVVMPYPLFDLLPSHSFIHFLKKAGFQPFFLEWRGKEIKNKSAMTKIVVQAYQYICCQVGRPSVLGFYSGSHHVCALSQEASPPPAIVFLSPPAHFKPLHSLSLLNNMFFSAYGYVPSFLARLIFSTEKKDEMVKKMLCFCDASPLFVACEDALNRLGDLPLFLLHQYVQESTCNFFCDLENVFVLYSKKNPPAFSSVYGKKAKFFPFSCSPLGGLASSSAPLHVWKPLVEWLHRNNKKI